MRAKWRWCARKVGWCAASGYLYIYIHTKLGVAVPVRAREQGRFRGSTKGSKETTEGARGNTKGAPREVLRGGAGAQQMAA